MASPDRTLAALVAEAHRLVESRFRPGRVVVIP
jgi:hypothetical protein